MTLHNNWLHAHSTLTPRIIDEYGKKNLAALVFDFPPNPKFAHAQTILLATKEWKKIGNT